MKLIKHMGQMLLLTLVLTTAILWTSAPRTQAATVQYSGTCGDNLTWTLDDEGILSISGIGTMKNYTSTYAPWYSYRSKIKNIVIGESVTSIGTRAFYSCTSLTSVTIPDSITTIGASAFCDCDSLTNVTIPDSVITIGGSAFRPCSSLTGIWVEEGNTTYSSDARGVLFNKDKTQLIQAPGTISGSYTIPNSVTAIGNHAFRSCTGLTSVTIPDSVTTVGNYAFRSCTGLTSVTIPDNVTAIGDSAFYQCDLLSSVTIGDGVTTIGDSAFWNCSRLADVIIGDSVTTIDVGAFAECTSLKKLTIGDSVTVIGASAFAFCDSLTSVTIPNSVSTISDAAFYYCERLTSVTIPDGVANIGDGAFACCYNLDGIWVREGNAAYSSDEHGVLFNKDKTILVAYPGSFSGAYSIPDSVTTVGDYAFRGCNRLSAVTIPDSVTAIGNYAFRTCTGLISVTIPDSVTTVGSYAFSSCSDLVSVMIPDSVTSIGGYAFSDCDSLTDVYYMGTETQWNSISIGSNNTPLTNAELHFVDFSSMVVKTLPAKTQYLIGESLDTTGLTLTVTYPDGTTEDITEGFAVSGFDSSAISRRTVTVTYEGFAASFVVTVQDSGSCGKYLTWTLDDAGTLTISGTGSMDGYSWSGYAPWNKYDERIFHVQIEEGVTSIGSLAFYNCNSLMSVAIPNGVTSIGSYAFSGCSSLTSVAIPDGVRSINMDTFYGCYALTSITIPDSVTVIENDAFDCCVALTSVTIPDSVTDIAYDAFKDCIALTSVTIPASVKTIGEGAFAGCDSLTGIWVDKNNPYFVSESTGVLFNKKKTLLIQAPGALTGSYVIPDSVTAIGKEAFYDCNALTSVIIGDSVTAIRASAFYDCDVLTSVTIGDGVSSIANSAFGHCVTLSSVSIGNGVKTIDGSAFSRCKALNYTVYNDARYLGNAENPYLVLLSADSEDIDTCIVHDNTKVICGDAFKECVALTSVTIGDSVKRIDEEAFRSCEALTAVTIPESVTSIGWCAFTGCDALTDVYYGSTAEQWAEITMEAGNEPLTDATIHFVEPELIGITVSTQPDKTTYAVGEALDATGMVLTLTYDNGTVETVTDGFTVTGFDSATVGTKTVTVTYEDLSATFTVTVECSTHTGGEATCKDKAVCAVCSASYGDLNAKNHKGSTYISGRIEPTYTTEGYTGDTCCSDCDAVIKKGSKIPVLVQIPVLEIVTQPADVAITAGFVANFTVEANNVVSYRWQYRRNENAPWISTTLPGSRTAALSVPAILGRNGYQYRCVLSGKSKQTLTTQTVTLTVLDSITITEQPMRQIVNVDSNAVFAVKAEGVGLTYQWLYRKNDEDFWKQTGLTGNKTATLTVPALQARNGYQYMCAITDENGIKINSKVAVLSAIGFTSQPEDQTVGAGGNAVFKATAKGQSLTYQWQYRKSDTGSWLTTSLSGYNTNTLTVQVTTGRNGYQYRCRITDALGTIVYSDAATLLVGITVTAQPTDQTAEVNTNAVFTVKATGTGLTYQWQYRRSESGNWLNTSLTGATTSKLTVEALAGRNGYQYRCVITDTNGCVINTDIVTLTVE